VLNLVESSHAIKMNALVQHVGSVFLHQIDTLVILAINLSAEEVLVVITAIQPMPLLS